MNQQVISTDIFVNRCLVFTLAISIFAFICSLVMDRVFEHAVCKFCVIQRSLFFFVTITSLSGIFLSSKKFVTVMIATTNLAISLVACYHLSIQFGLVNDSCSIRSHDTFDQFINSVLHAPTPCANLVYAFGIPMSGWSIIFSLIGLIITSRIFICAKFQ